MRNHFLADLKTAISQTVHQCNNHLSIILSNSELALSITDGEKIKKKIESNMNRVSQLTELLLQLNKLATVNTEIKNVHLKSFFELSLKQVQAQASSRHIQCSTKLTADGLLPIPAHVFELIIELVGANGMSAATTGSVQEISVEVLKSDAGISIKAHNSGKMPESTIDRDVFKNYFSNRNEPVYDMLGAIKCLTEFLGGEVSYKSKGVTNEIFINLPLKYENDI